MQLYSSNISPYASRCRIQIRHKNLPVDIVPPPGGMGSAEVKARNPIGKVPVLDLGDRALGESWAIMEYLEALHPTPAMWSADAFQQARTRELVRFVDLYLAPSMFPLFLALRGAADDEAVAKAVTGVQTQMTTLDALLARDADRERVSDLELSDAALLPIVWYARVLTKHFGTPDCLADAPTVTDWWQTAKAQPAAAAVLDEMETGLKAALPALFKD